MFSRFTTTYFDQIFQNFWLIKVKSQKVGRTTESKSILVYEYWWFLYKHISGIFKLRKEFQLCVYLEKTSCPLSGKLHFFLTFIEQALSTPVRLNQVFLPQVVLLLATIQSCSRDTYYFLICFNQWFFLWNCKWTCKYNKKKIKNYLFSVPPPTEKVY